MSLLNLNIYGEDDYVSESEVIDLFDGTPERLIQESLMEVHGIFESMYEIDVEELKFVAESVLHDGEYDETVLESKIMDKIKGIGGRMKSALETMAKAVMKVIYGAIDFLKKLKKSNADWLKSYVKEKTSSKSSAKVKGYNFPDMGDGMSASNLEEAFQKFASKLDGQGPREFAFSNGTDAVKVFNEKKESAINAALGSLCGQSSVSPSDFAKAAHEDAFGGKEPQEINMSLDDAKAMLSSEIDKEISALVTAKRTARKAFDNAKKKFDGADVSKMEGNDKAEGGSYPQIASAYVKCFGVIKAYYVKRIKIGIQAAHTAAAQCKKVVHVCYKKEKKSK